MGKHPLPRQAAAMMLALAFLLITTAAVAATGFATPKVDYSGENLIKTEGAEITQRIYYSGGKERREQTVGGVVQIVIVRPDKDLIWVVMPAQNIYLEQAMTGNEGQLPLEESPVVTGTAAGTETIDGHKTTKRRISSKGADGSSFEGTTWTTAEGILMRMDGRSTTDMGSSTFSMKLRNLKIGQQDAALFELPSGVRKMELPAAVGSMGGAPPSSNMGGDGTDVGGGGMRKR